MNTKRSILETAFVLTALLVSLLLAGAARAQNVSPQFIGKFTLTSPVDWGKSTLSPGTYTLRIDSTALPIMATIRNERDDCVARVMTRATEDYTSGSNALELKVRDGRFVVKSLVLADLNMVLIFDPSPAHERVEKAQLAPSVPVLVARK